MRSIFLRRLCAGLVGSILAAPAALAADKDSNGFPDRFKNMLEKSTLPSNKPKGGVRTSLTKEETIFPKAAPMMMPTPMSMTFHLSANSLKSLSTMTSR